MTKDTRNFIVTYPICQKIKHARHAPYGLLQLVPMLNQPFEVATMDFIGNLPKGIGIDTIFMLVFKLTKYAFFIPCNTNLIEQKAACLFFDKSETHVGLPKQIISDQDTWWRNIFWKEICEAMGARWALTTAYHPQAGGQTEILNQTIVVTICAYMNQTGITGQIYFLSCLCIQQYSLLWHIRWCISGFVCSLCVLWLCISTVANTPADLSLPSNPLVPPPIRTRRSDVPRLSRLRYVTVWLTGVFEELSEIS